MAKTRKNSYDADSIKTIESDRDRVRIRPTIYIPTKDEFGAMHVIFEIADNSIDELAAKDTNGDTMSLEFDEVTKVVTVTDNGRGIPQAKLLDVCTILNSSGKYDNTEGSPYETPGGTNGVGLKLGVYLSEWCEATSIQHGKSLTYRFVDGYLKETIESKCKGHGTIVKFKIDNSLIKINQLKTEDLIKRYEEKSYPNSKIKMNLMITRKGKKKESFTYYGKDIVARVEMMHPDTEVVYGSSAETVSILQDIDDKNLTDKKVLVEFALAFKEDAIDEEDDTKYMLSYGNTIKTYHGGTHVLGMRDGVVKFFRQELQPKLNKRDRDVPVVPADIYGGLCGFVIAKVAMPEFRGQYKDELLNPEARRAVRDSVFENLKNSSNAFKKKMGEFVIRTARGRLESKKTRTRSKDITNSFSKDRIDLFTPWIDTTETTEPELILVEGKSAADVVTTARDPYNQGVYPIKRPKNIFDKDSDISTQIVGVFNDIMNICDIQPGKKCDPDKSAVSKILCLTDGDIDGDRIAISTISLLAKHCRPLIDAGMVGRILPPAYMFRDGKKMAFVRDQREFYRKMSKKFVADCTVTCGNKTMTKSEVSDFVQKNFEYNTRLAKLAERYTCDPKLMEYVASKYHGELADQKQSYWSKAMKQYPDISVLKEEGYVLIDGTIGMEPYHIALDEYFHRHVTKFKAYQNLNTNIDGYTLNGEPATIYDIMHKFDNYLPPEITRFKGLGELNPEDMSRLCLDRESRSVAIFKFKDFNEDMEKLDLVMSSRASCERARNKLMRSVVLDDIDLDT